MINTVRDSARCAIERKDFNEDIRVEDFSEAYRQNKGCLSEENVFLSHNWRTIIPENSRIRHAPNDEIRVISKGKRRG